MSLSVCCGASDAGVAPASVVAESDVAAGEDRCASACTVRVESITNIVVNAIDVAPASNQILTGVFEFKLFNIRFISICLFY